MNPITVYDAAPGRPFTRQIAGPTLFDLLDAVQALVNMGYGGTHFCRADFEGGPHLVTKLELYETSDELEQGILLSDTVFLLC